MIKFLVSIFIYFLISNTVTGQVCTGSLGDPVINNTFGFGRNPGAQLPVTSTTYPYTANSCPPDGFYTITNSAFNCHSNSWHNIPEDHTPGDTAGYMMIVNASTAPGIFYVETVNGLCGGTTYEFAAWILNVGIGTFCAGNPIHPDVTFSIETTAGVILKTYNTGNIPFFASPTWTQYGTFFTTPAGVTSVVVKMTNNAPGGCGNDLALDDITFRPCGPLVTATIGGTNSVSICSSNVTPTLLSATVSSGYVTPYYQWQISADSGVTWNNIPFANGLNYTIPAVYIQGNYFFRLTVSEAANSANIACRTVSNIVTLKINPSPPVPSFTASAPDCINKTVTFTDQPTSPAGALSSWIWNFGDGSAVVTATTNANQVHTYASTGTYTVTLQVQGTGGCLSPVFSLTVIIPSSPVFDFTYNDTCVNQPIQFSTTATGTYNWNFDDATSSVLQNPVKTYTTAGTYNVTLQVIFAGGCTGSVTHPVIIGNLPATPSFTIAPASACVNQAVIFTDQPVSPAGSITEWIWNFGDGSPVVTATTNAAQVHTFTTGGTYTITLQVRGVGGCLSSVFQNTITISAIPATPSFNAVTTACINQPVTFTDVPANPAGSITQWIWDFGDGSPVVTATTNAAQIHTYTTAGSYTVKLQLTGVGGCTSSVFSQIITIGSAPAVDFTFTPGCLNAGTTFTVTNPGPAGTLYQWTFGDGNTSTQTNPSNTYNTAGTYNVSLSVNFTGGCSNNAAHQVIIGALPLTPAFVAVPATACVNQQVTFTGTSTNPAGTITQWIWNFGDGSPVVNAPTNAAQPHTYTTAGTYIVTLQVKNTAGCLSLVFQNTITIGAIPATPSFNAVSTACLNQPVTFTDVPANPAASITQWTWNFGDGSPVVTAGTNAPQVHTFTVAGAYTVTLQLTGVGGCVSAVFQQTITITAAPVIDFTSTPGCLNAATTFAVTNPGPAGTQYQWTFGDGNTSTQTNPSNTYNTAGTFTVTLTVNAGSGCSGNKSHTLIINSLPALPSFAVAAASCAGNTVNITNQTPNTSGNIAAWIWNFGDGSPLVTTTTYVNQVHTYTAAGTFTISLQVKNILGCLSPVFQQTINVGAVPTVDFTFSSTCEKNPVQFTANTNAGTGAVFAWSFGNGTTAAIQNPSYTYNAGGTYTVNLQVTTTAGCSASVSHPVTVASAPPTPSFTGPATFCIAKPVTFVPQAATPPGVTKWIWNFGDGSPVVNAISNVSQIHTYATAGNYNVSLQLEGIGGCLSNVFQVAVTISPNPVVDFSFTNSCQNTPVNFTSATNGSVVQWKFGDGVTTATQNPVHTYTTGGSYIATLIVKSAAGCIDSVKKPVAITAKPIADFQLISPDTICSDKPVTISNSSAATGTLSYTKIYWNWTSITDTTGDNTPTSGENYIHTYASFHSPAFDKAIIRLVASTGIACEAEKFDTVYLKAIPNLVFGPVPLSCEGDSSFLITSANDLSGMTGQFSFSGPGVSTQGTFYPVVAGAGTHTILYAYQAANGCLDSITGTVSVVSKPQISAGPDKAVKVGERVQISATSNSIYNYTWTPAATLSSNVILQPFASPAVATVYILSAVSAEGCKAVDSVLVQILKAPVIPNVFSPNHDGVNDTWVLKNLSLYTGCNVDIFNRYGGKVFSSVGYSKPWDGMYNDKPCPVGVYYYIIKLDAKTPPLSGWVTLLR